jgi:HD-GYP domain-containing protein (c-di-GMP phosphodiesterase class II)
MTAVADAARAQVIVLSGPLAGAVVEVGDKLTLGRRPENTLRLRDDQVSRYHAIIERRGEQYVVEDLGSRTGTMLDGRPIERSAPLTNGSQLVIGETVLRFTTDGEDFEDEPTHPKDSLSAESARSFRDPRRRNGSLREAPHATITLDIMEEPFSKDLGHTNANELRRAGEHLQTLLTANSIIASELDVERLFEKILDQIFRALPAHRAVIMTKEQDGGGLRIRASRLASGDALSEDNLVSTTIVNRAFRDRVGVLTLDAGVDARFDARQSIVDQNIRSALCVPMVHQDTALGVIYLDTVGVSHAFKEDDLKLLTGIAGPAGGAVKNALLVAQLKNTAADTILRLAMAAEYRDDDTGFHIHRMSDYAEAIARALGTDDIFASTLKLASPMHDVGKIGIRDAILKKPGRLTPEEFEEMKQHTVKGGAILSKSDSELLKMAEHIALTHHEKYDGSGYPKRLKGEHIPLEGRIVAVADVFDALTTKRCYKPAFSLEDAFGEIAAGRGRHFDPRIAECFLSIRERIISIRDHYLNLEAESQTGDVPPLPSDIQRHPAP